MNSEKAESCIIKIKVLFEKDTYHLLGTQIVGFDGVDKRIDVLATAIRAEMKAYRLAELDLAYAPPYSSAKADFAAISPCEFLQATGLTATILQVAFDSAMRCKMTKN